MKKTFTINLSGTVYHIDEDAYNLLDNYLENLKHYFRKEEGGDEIIDDIERRIAELCAEKQSSGKQIITIVDVEEIIAQIGKPEQMGCEDNDAYSHDDNHASNQTESAKTPRRLFRNPDDVVIDGVISGFAIYLGVDVTVARLLTLILLVLGCGTLIPIYIICMIVIPKANTAAEKLSMRGESVTIENIGKTVTNTFDKVANEMNDYVNSDKPRTHLQKVGDVLMRIFSVVLKAFMILFVAMIVPVLFVLAIALFVLIILTAITLIKGSAVLIATGMTLPPNPLSFMLMCIAGVLVVGIPIAILLWLALGWLCKWKQSTAPKWGLLLLWIVSIACFVITLAHNGFTLAEMGWLNC